MPVLLSRTLADWWMKIKYVVKLTEAQVALSYALNDCNVFMCLNGFNIPPHIW